jgi:TonB family protein
MTDPVTRPSVALERRESVPRRLVRSIPDSGAKKSWRVGDVRDPRRVVRNGSLALAALMGVLTAAPVAHAQERIGDFQYTPRVDAIMDTDESSIFVVESEPTILRRAQLRWRCDTSEDIELFVSVDAFLNSGASVPVVWRFDRNAPSPPSSWSVSTNGTAAFAPREDVVQFTLDALPADQVLIRVTDYRGVETDLAFSLTGLTLALRLLSCGDLATAEIDEDLPPPWEEQATDLSSAPTFTPFTVAPTIQNRSEIIRAMEREYPPLLRDAGIGGSVRVFFFIDENGSVQDYRIDSSSGHQSLDDAALAVADVYRFTAAFNRGKKVPAWVSFPISFQVR